MRDIDITVTNKLPRTNGIQSIVADNTDYRLNFVFDEEWIGEKKVLIVSSTGELYEPIIMNDNSVIVPAIKIDEIAMSIRGNKHKSLTIYVGVAFGDVLTTQPLEMRVVPSIKSMIFGDLIHDDPKSSRWIIDKMYELLAKFDKIDESVARAEISATAAQNAANSMSFVTFEIDYDGDLYVNRAEILGTTAFMLNLEGELEVEI